MAITLLQKRKLQQYFIFIFAVMLAATSLILWLGFRKKQELLLEVFVPQRELKINFDVLKNPLLDELEPFERLVQFEGQSGREDPFLPR